MEQWVFWMRAWILVRKSLVKNPNKLNINEKFQRNDKQ